MYTRYRSQVKDRSPGGEANPPFTPGVKVLLPEKSPISGPFFLLAPHFSLDGAGLLA